jgi:hypothetical protein
VVIPQQSGQIDFFDITKRCPEKRVHRPRGAQADVPQLSPQEKLVTAAGKYYYNNQAICNVHNGAAP